jgi:hypothetical protein
MIDRGSTSSSRSCSFPEERGGVTSEGHAEMPAERDADSEDFPVSKGKKL